jgi:hypothetical protein
MRIGVLTFHRCINYGSYWQARCLVEGLRNLRHDAVLLDHRSAQIDLAEWRCALSPVPGDRSGREAYGRKVRAFFQAFDQLPQSLPFELEHPHGLGSLDLVVVGSDEVWNMMHPWYGGRDLFYGRGFDSRLVAYAASCGNQVAGAPLPTRYKQLLRGFSQIAVRDENSRRIVADAIQKQPELVLDPCLQFSGSIVTARSLETTPYVGVYGHSFPSWFSQMVRNWADTHGLRLVSLGYRNAWTHHEWIDAGPLEFPGFIAGAAAVVTNFFHGCVFSLVNCKPFICAPSEYRNNKVRDLLGLVHASDRLVANLPEPAILDDLLEQPAGARTQTKIARLREISSRYLDHALQ